MRPREELIKEGIINDKKNIPNSYIALFYKEQLNKFHSIGLGKTTEFGVKVTQELINLTEKRLYELKPMRKGV